MTFAAINYLSISINLLLVVFVFVCFLMTLLILMQRPKQEGLGAAFGAGVTDQVFGARTTNVLQRGTVYLATAFFILSLTLAILIGLQNRKNSLLVPKAPVKQAVEAPAAEPEKPKSLSEELPPTDSTPVTPEIPAPAPEAPAPAPEIPAPAPEAPAPAPEAPAPAPEAPAPAPEAPAPAPEAPAPASEAPAPAPEAPAPDKTEGQ